MKREYLAPATERVDMYDEVQMLAVSAEQVTNEPMESAPTSSESIWSNNGSMWSNGNKDAAK